MKKYLGILLLAITTTSLTSCLKDGRVNLPPGGSPPVIEFSTTLLGAPVSDVNSPVGVFLRNVDLVETQTFEVTAHYTGGGMAPQDITVNIDNDPSQIAVFNDYEDLHDESAYILMPSNLFSGSPGSVVIKKGSNIAKFTITVKPKLFDLTVGYLIPFRMTSVSSGTISKNFSNILINVAPKNQWDGIYIDHGYALRQNDPDLTGYFKGQSIPMITSGPFSVQFSPKWNGGGGIAGIDGTTATVNPTTNKVTMSSTANPVLVNDPSYDNRYDPATKTFYLSFYWGSGINNRAHRDTLVFSQPR
jgi:hypothetical protein